SGAHNEALALLDVANLMGPVAHAEILPTELATSLHGTYHSQTSTSVLATQPEVGPPASPLAVPTPATPEAADAVPPLAPESKQSAETIVGPTAPAYPDSPTPVNAEPSIPAVLAAMQQFAHDVGPHLAVLVTGNQVIEYDQYALTHTPAAVSAVT